MCFSGRQKRIDIPHAQRIGQAHVLGRAFDLQHRIIGAPTFFMGEAVELLERGKTPRPCGRCKACGIHLGQICLEHGAIGLREASAAPGKIGLRILEVAPIGQLRVARGPLLGGLRGKKGRDPSGVRRGHWLGAGVSKSSCSAERLARSSSSTLRNSASASVISDGSRALSDSTSVARKIASPKRSLRKNQA